MEAVILVDIQKAFDDFNYWGGERNNPQLEENVALLLDGARKAGLAIIHVKHNSKGARSPLNPSAPGNALKPEAAPRDGETVISKEVNSAFIGTDLESRLRRIGATDLVIFGITTDQCVSTTTRMAANLGFNVRIVDDACATFPKRLPSGRAFDAQTIHDANLASLSEEFAQVVKARDVVDGWAERAAAAE